eukprot:tig00000215_g18593.t1
MAATGRTSAFVVPAPALRTATAAAQAAVSACSVPVNVPPLTREAAPGPLRPNRQLAGASSESAFFGTAVARATLLSSSTFTVSPSGIELQAHAWRETHSFDFDASRLAPPRLAPPRSASPPPSPISIASSKRPRSTSPSPTEALLDRARSEDALFEGKAEVKKQSRNSLLLSYATPSGDLRTISVAARTARPRAGGLDVRSAPALSTFDLWAFHDPSDGRLLVCTHNWLVNLASSKGVVPEWALRAAGELGDCIYLKAGEPLAAAALHALLDRTLEFLE